MAAVNVTGQFPALSSTTIIALLLRSFLNIQPSVFIILPDWKLWPDGAGETMELKPVGVKYTAEALEVRYKN
jgi:hypothetical protein